MYYSSVSVMKNYLFIYLITYLLESLNSVNLVFMLIIVLNDFVENGLASEQETVNTTHLVPCFLLAPCQVLQFGCPGRRLC